MTLTGRDEFELTPGGKVSPERLQSALEVIVGLPVGWDPCAVNIKETIKDAVADCVFGWPGNGKISTVSGARAPSRRARRSRRGRGEPALHPERQPAL